MTKPYRNSAATKLIGKRIDELRGIKTQSDIAREAGFVNSNFLTMLKSGANKVPLDRVPDLARALDIDPALLMRLGIEQSIGVAQARAVLDIFGSPVTENEILWIQELRNASEDSDPRPTAKGRAALRALFGK